ncbi:hypothetical protein BJX96DRAFT_167011 [Aspergillus floccosus]
MSRRPIYINPPAAHARCETTTTDSVRAFHQSLPDYAPTPLVALPELARELGVRAVFVKDESNRFGLPSFKALGASWGCYRAVAGQLGCAAGSVALNELASKAQDAGITLFAATEGNHGRAVAFMARLLGVRARIFVPRGTDEATRGRIASEGAEVLVSRGSYDDAVSEAAGAALESPRGVLIQDTAFDGYEEVPAWIVEGYATMLAETEEQLAREGLRCDAMVTPVGVGSLAHAVSRFCKARGVAVVAVEPDSAPCLYESLRASQPVTVAPTATIMDGMNCGTVSSTAWPDLRRLVDVCVTVSSAESHAAVQYLATRSVLAGPCGGASLAALHRMARESQELLCKDSVLVLLSTEGARPYTVPRDVAVDDVVGLTQALTRIDSSNSSLSVSDGAGESEIAEYIAAWFAHRDIEHHRVETVPGRPSIVGVLRGCGGAPSLMFNGHTDTVSLSSYEGDALSGTLAERNGRQVVLGRGTIDMKGGLAAALAAVASVKASGQTLRGDVIVAAVSDEEDASQGTRDVIAAGWRADAAVVAEPTMGEIITAHKGFVWVEVDILGVAAHGSDPTQGRDAILSAGRFLRALEEYQTHLPVDEMLGQASLHCGLIQGGEEPSSYPAKCTVTVEFRTVPSQTEESIVTDLKTLLEEIVRQKPEFRYAEPRITMSRPTHKLSAEHPLVQSAEASATAISGRRPAVVSVPFWCDASLLGEAGIPSIVYGPKGEGLHIVDPFFPFTPDYQLNPPGDPSWPTTLDWDINQWMTVTDDMVQPAPASGDINHLTDVTQWLDGAYAPPNPCTYCRRHRLQCLIIRTTPANPNPVTSCSSCVALFRECSLAHGEKRQPSGFETLAPVLGNLHGLREHTEDAILEHEPAPGEPHRPSTSGLSHPVAEDSKAESKQFVRRGARVLRAWLAQNQEYPYPSEEDKTRLAQETGFSRKRIATWFANARRRQKHKADSAAAAAAPLTIHRAGSPMPAARADVSTAWTAMTPLERWQASPPEDDPVAESVIQDAIASSAGAGSEGSDAGGLDDGALNAFLAFDETSSCVGSSVGGGRGGASSDSVSSSASAWSHYSLSDSGGSLGVPLAGRPPSRQRRRRPHRRRTSASAAANQYHCTFCAQTFKKKNDWYRHETTVHLPLDTWICTPSLAELLPPATLGSEPAECRFCTTAPATAAHWDEHDFRVCAEKPAAERSFTRKDHLWQHLRKFHGCTKTPAASLDVWRRDETKGPLRSRCGFCGAELATWMERGEHLAEHFRQGVRMDQWVGGLGLESEVLRMVRYAD